MIWMTFECPETGRPLRTVQAPAWLAETTDTRMALHCPKCSQMHRFSRDHAILEMDSRRARPKLPV